jgi:hypothetical protein
LNSGTATTHERLSHNPTPNTKAVIFYTHFRVDFQKYRSTSK